MKEIKSRTGETELQPREYVAAGPVRPKRKGDSPIPALPEPKVSTTSICPHCGKDIAT